MPDAYHLQTAASAPVRSDMHCAAHPTWTAAGSSQHGWHQHLRKKQAYSVHRPLGSLVHAELNISSQCCKGPRPGCGIDANSQQLTVSLPSCDHAVLVPGVHSPDCSCCTISASDWYSRVSCCKRFCRACCSVMSESAVTCSACSCSLSCAISALQQAYGHMLVLALSCS